MVGNRLWRTWLGTTGLMFKKVLIANRGEIAMRVIRSCRALGIRTVAIHSEADEGALHVRFADEAVCIGPADAQKSYLNIPAIIAAAEVTNADAVHPGYGFLSENPTFAEVCDRCNLTFIGPTPEAMRLWGDKVSGRANAVKFGLPLLPGTKVLSSAEEALSEARRIGFPGRRIIHGVTRGALTPSGLLRRLG